MTVLVVDDDPLSLKLLRIVLAGEGYEVLAARDAFAAAALADRRPPDVLLTDLDMPGVDGLALIRRFRAEAATRDALIVAITAYTGYFSELQARMAGCDAYVTKPVDVNSLLVLLAALLDARRRSS